MVSGSQDMPVIKPLVSVGIPTYNRPAGLRHTLECITRQTYRNLEIIVSDNCSPGPETEQVVRGFMEKDPRIQYYRQEANKGPTHNIEFVIGKSTGDYVMCAADDDGWEDTYIEKCLQEFLKNDALVLCYSEAAKWDDASQQKSILASDITTVGMGKLSGIKKLLLNQYRNIEFYGLMKADVAQTYTFKNFFGEDNAFVLFLALHGEVGRTEPGLFINGPGFAGCSPTNTTQSLGLHRLNSYFGYIFLIFNSIKMLFEYKFDLTAFEKAAIIALIFRRAITVRYLAAIKLGFTSLFRDFIGSTGVNRQGTGD